MKSTKSDVCYFEENAVFKGEPVELQEESTWTEGLRRTGNDTGKDFACRHLISNFNTTANNFNTFGS